MKRIASSNPAPRQRTRHPLGGAAWLLFHRRERFWSGPRDPDAAYRDCNLRVPACRDVALGVGGCTVSLSFRR